MSYYKRWKEGMKNITPLQQLHAKMVGHYGGALGLCLATVVMLWKGVWYFGVFLFFMIWLQAWEALGAKQRYGNALEMQKRMEELQKESENGGVEDGVRI